MFGGCILLELLCGFQRQPNFPISMSPRQGMCNEGKSPLLQGKLVKSRHLLIRTPRECDPVQHHGTAIPQTRVQPRHHHLHRTRAKLQLVHLICPRPWPCSSPLKDGGIVNEDQDACQCCPNPPMTFWKSMAEGAKPCGGTPYFMGKRLGPAVSPPAPPPKLCQTSIAHRPSLTDASEDSHGRWSGKPRTD